MLAMPLFRSVEIIAEIIYCISGCKNRNPEFIEISQKMPWGWKEAQKTMKNFLMVLASILLLTGCRVPEPPPVPVSSGEPRQSIVLGNTILEAFQRDDYSAFSRIKVPFPEPGGRAYFQEFRTRFTEKFGMTTGSCFLTELKTPLVRNLIYVVRCRKEGRAGMTVERELLFRLVTAETDGRLRVVWMGFL